TVPCVSATAVGNFAGTLQTVSASTLGLAVTVEFRATPNASTPHAVISVQAKLLVTKATDPAYFRSDPAYAQDPLAAFLPAALVNDELGTTPKFLGLPVGVAPFAAPGCRGNSCPSTPAPSTYPFCADVGVAGTVRSAVAAFFSIGTAGTTYVSAPLVQSTQVTCPF